MKANRNAPIPQAAAELLDERFKKVREQDSLAYALGQFTSSKDVLYVFDDGDYRGIIREKDLIRTRMIPSSEKVKRFISYAPVIGRATPIPECARLMIENDVRSLPVIEKGRMIGVVGDMAILDAYPDFREIEIKEYMTGEIVTISPDMKISSVIGYFRNHQISHLPVEEGGIVYGMVAMHDIRKIYMPKERKEQGEIMAEKKNILSLPVENIMSKPIFSAYEDDTAASVIEKMRENDIGSMLIFRKVNDLDTVAETLSGIVTRKDLLEVVADMQAKPVAPSISVGSKSSDIDRKAIADILEQYTCKHPDILGRSAFYAYLSKHKETFRDEHLLSVRIRIHAPGGRYIASAEGWGEENAVKNALLKIEKQIQKGLEAGGSLSERLFEEVLGFEDITYEQEDESKRRFAGMMHSGISPEEENSLGL